MDFKHTGALSMSDEKMNSFRRLFVSKLDTLSHILEVSEKHFHNGVEPILNFRLIDDMLPFGTQISYSCDQPHNFVLWCEGKETDHLDPEIQSVDQAKQLIERTKSRLMEVDLKDSMLTELKRIELGGERYIELPGLEYVNEFLVPNLYFHLVTAYDIMRMKGVSLAKENYMMHLVPLIKQT